METEPAPDDRLHRALPGRRRDGDFRLTSPAAAGARTCSRCATQIAPLLLSCPQCGQLVHAAELKQLAADAATAEAAGDLAGAASLWQDTLVRLPAGTRQAEVIAARVEALGHRMVTEPGRKPDEKRPGWTKGGGIFGAIGLLLWKLKVVLILVLTKAKLLLLGLTKLGTLASMLLAFGVYWTVWGWPFAAGLIVSMYIHEMGHVTWLARYGIRASPPMFVPGLGALVRLKQYPPTPGLDARVGLAGPLWGLGAALIAWGIFLAGGGVIWGAIARVGAWINLFNLMPVWSLDGGRGFRALTKQHRFIAAAMIFSTWVATKESLLAVIGIMAVVRALAKDAPEKEDFPILAGYSALVLVLSLLAMLHVDPGAVIAR